MSKLPILSSSPRCYSSAGTFGGVQIVATSDKVVLDITGRHYTTTGILEVQHAVVSLPLEAAARVRDLLDAAIEAAADIAAPQPGLWSEATVSASAARFSGRASA